MHLIGLTGSIGMGKSTVAKLFKARGIPVFDYDAAVHEMYAKGGEAVDPIRAHYPSCVVGGAVDRPSLRLLVEADPKVLDVINGLVSDLLAIKAEQWAQAERAMILVHDIPLLFEMALEDRYDTIIVVNCPADIQMQRIIARNSGMSVELAKKVIAKQLPAEYKTSRADYVIDTSGTLEDTERNFQSIFTEIVGAYEQ